MLGEIQRGKLRYLDDTVISSLHRNGAVLIHRDRDGSDSRAIGLHFDAHEMSVRNARLDKLTTPTLKTNGFELFDNPLSNDKLNFFDHQNVVVDYYRQCAALVADVTGGHAFAFDHNVRSASGKKKRQKIIGGQQVQGPAHAVHGDYTLYSGPQRLRDLAEPPTGNDTLCSVLAPGESLLTQTLVERALNTDGRFAIINVWRNIAAEVVATAPLALCDGQSVVPNDLVVFEIHYENRIGENYFAKHSSAHRWYYYPEMRPEEAVLIKQWDSAGPLAQSGGEKGDGADPQASCTFSFHSALDDPSTPPDAPDRWSIEVRCVVLYDHPGN